MKQPVVVSAVGAAGASATGAVDTHTSFARLPSGFTIPPRTVTTKVVGVGDGVGFETRGLFGPLVVELADVVKAVVEIGVERDERVLDRDARAVERAVRARAERRRAEREEEKRGGDRRHEPRDRDPAARRGAVAPG